MVKKLLRKLIIGTFLEAPARACIAAFRNRKYQSVEEVTVPVLSTFLPITLPTGISEDELRQSMLSISIDGSPLGALDGYVADSFYRFIHTWKMVEKEKGKALELGANPYFTTYMLQKFTNLELTLANYFGGEDGLKEQTVTFQESTESSKFEFSYDHFNLEESRFPYPDNYFEVVLFCEIIEHLLMNPVQTLKEIHRVLKPNGLLVVTTPNVARFGNIIAIIEGRNIYDPYSGYGPYGRHNREYTKLELIHLLNFCGFKVEDVFTADAHQEDHSNNQHFALISDLVKDRSSELGQYLFVAVRKTGIPQDGLPASLFRSYPTDLLNFDW